MSADLTCSICGGSGERVCGPAEWCVLCNGTGRRLPKLAEWDALKAERDRYRDALEWIAGCTGVFGSVAMTMARRARTALDRKE